MILREDGQKMSKRRDPVSVVDYAGMGFLPEAMLSTIWPVGWGHGDAELFEMGEFVERFSLEAVSPSPARFQQRQATVAEPATYQAVDKPAAGWS